MVKALFLLLLAVPAFAGFELRSIPLTTFTDNRPLDLAFDDGAFASVGDGGADTNDEPSRISDPLNETAYVTIAAAENSATRMVQEFDIGEGAYFFKQTIYETPGAPMDASEAVLVFFLDYISEDMTIEAYGYIGDGAVTAADADITGDTLLLSQSVTGNIQYDPHELVRFEVDATDFIKAAQAANDRYVGIVIRIAGDENAAEKQATVWSGEVTHSVNNAANKLANNKVYDRVLKYFGPMFVANCVPDCPERPPITRVPQIRTLGDYPNAPAGVCEPLAHEADVAQVTLQDGERLDDAMERLNVLDEVDGVGEGGILNIPWDVETIQCDTLRVDAAGISPDDGTHKVSIKGQIGPNGEMPHWYCRLQFRDGTIARDEKPGPWGTIGRISNRQILIEGVHIDGYTDQLKSPIKGKFVFRSSYAHHGGGDGIANSNNYDWDGQLSIEVCGNELTHTGLDNAQHVMYLHRGIWSETAFNTTHIYDNFMNSCGYSSCVKSIAEYNNVIGNRFQGSATPDGSPFGTDVTFARQISQYHTDVISCGHNVIKDNTFIGYKDQASGGGAIIIGVRNRAGGSPIWGCDEPTYWLTEDGNNKIPGEVKGDYTNATDNPVYWGDEYWEGLNGTRPFVTLIENNQFSLDPAGAFGDRMRMTQMQGSFPNLAATLGLSYWLQAPPKWYERTVTQFKDNTYTGIALDKLYEQSTKGDCTNVARGCPYEPEGLLWPQAEDTTPPYPPTMQYCADTVGVEIKDWWECALINPPINYEILGGETIIP